MNFLSLSKHYLGTSYSAKQVYKTIGGKVLWNHENNPTQFNNSCALRMSYALNKSGYFVPYHSRQTGSGSDKKWYFYRVKDLKKYLDKQLLGNVQITRTPKDADYKNAFKNKTGIIVFEVDGWRDASGHITLWDGKTCGDHCYFEHQRDGIETRKVMLWIL